MDLPSQDTSNAGSSEDVEQIPLIDSSRPMSEQIAVKRKRQSAGRVVKQHERKKVSRACDVCKLRKLRCTGTQPCSRCLSHGLPCEYNSEHRRGVPASPEPITTTPVRDNRPQSSLLRESQRLSPSRPSEPPVALELPSNPNRLQDSSRSSQEPEETRLDGHYIGPTSGIAFLDRAQRRFKQDFVATNSSAHDGTTSSHSSIFSFGDGQYPKASPSDLVLPSRQHLKYLFDKYFDFAMPTYRFLHRQTTETWLNLFCNEYDGVAHPSAQLSHAKAAVVLLILATSTLYGGGGGGSEDGVDGDEYERSWTFYSAAEARMMNETGPVRMESVQARLASSLYLLGSSRINQAWYTFGTTSQMILALGLHRKKFSQSPRTSNASIEAETRRQVFWGAYTLDKYLSVILGRPRVFRDEDTDQPLPERTAEDTVVSGRGKSKPSECLCVSDGPMYHAKLAIIVAKITSELYPAHRNEEINWIEIAQQRTAELKAWKQSLPAFLEPEKVDPSMLIQIYQRQSTVLRLAYLHALILANRPSLLNNFADLSRPQNLATGESESCLKECIDAATQVVDIVNDFVDESRMRKPFWFTHYISFCAISALYVYTIQKNSSFASNASQVVPDGKTFTKHFEAAERCQRKIYETTATRSPFRRYNIILDELKREVLIQLNRIPSLRNDFRTTEAADVNEAQRNLLRAAETTGSSSDTPLLIPSTVAGAYTTYDPPQIPNVESNNTAPLQTYAQEMTFANDTTPQFFSNTIMDYGIFGQQELGWAEFDSCALAWPDLDAMDWNM
ncbi:uncharacterized protein PAC_02201 [Phialocephala subalpina]|uniref:Zn(2)-C6 fungal-type domain-containing protein n=1 Tax=Phialocephala subalpina TaxID=576137 RepID=A0A1L7WHR2_9HELO|nr:uncharacterized protein PAC_02201 [Phialocephala subalpina]